MLMLMLGNSWLQQRQYWKKANEEIADEEVDITDLEEAAHSKHTKGWHSQAVVNLEFELTGETGWVWDDHLQMFFISFYFRKTPKGFD